MNGNVIKGVVLVVLLAAVQVMFLNRIHIFGCATPLLLVYAIIILPLNVPRWLSLLTGFCLGLVSDTFTNTPGVATMTLTFIAFIQPPLLRLFSPRDAADNLQPALKSLGALKFFVYSLILTLINCALLYSLESFDVSLWRQILLNTGGSTVLSYIFIFTLEHIRGRG